MKINIKVLKRAVLIVLLFVSNFRLTSGVCKGPKIVIVGSGAAGIAAASKLFENGFTDVTVLEAENRVGGRVYTTKFGEYTIDLGGQWVEGEKGNIAFELAYPHGLLLKSNEPKYGLTYENMDSRGNVDKNGDEIIDFYFDYIYDLENDNFERYESFGDYIDEKFNEVFQDEPDILTQRNKYLHHLELFAVVESSATSWYDMFLVDDDDVDFCAGDHLISWKDTGYSTIFDILTKRYPDPREELPVADNTILNSEVVSINYANRFREEHPVIIETANGKTYKADHVIVTVPLGVLKEKHDTLFYPPLSSCKVDAIQSIGYGHLGKIFLLFKKPFWNRGNRRVVFFSFMWNENDFREMERDPQKAWLLGMSGAMTVENRPNILEVWVSGKYSGDMEKLSEEQIFNDTMQNFHRFLGKRYKIETPIAMLRTQWYTNPHFRGTYSYRTVRMNKRHVTAEILEEPIDTHNLAVLFAGEATSVERYGTVDGAIASGWKAAERLIDHYADY